MAIFLARLWRLHGEYSWQQTSLNGAPTTMSTALGWHNGAMPLRGVLALTFCAQNVASDAAAAISRQRGEGLLMGFASDAMSDLWRLSYLKVLVQCFYLPGVLAAQVRLHHQEFALALVCGNALSP